MSYRSLCGGVTFIMAVLGAGAPSAQARQSPPAEEFFYLGADLGYARIGVSPSSPGWTDASSNHVAVGLRGGYQFSRYLSVESTVTTLGSVEARTDGQKDRFAIGGMTASVVGHLPITDRFSLLALVGLGLEHGQRTGDIDSSSRSVAVITFGAGAAYAISSNWRIRAQYTNYDKLKWKGGNGAEVKSQAFVLGVDYLFR